MNTTEEFDDRYVRFREHADVRERVTALESDKVQVAAALIRIEAMLNARIPPAQQALPVDHTALAMQRALDLIDRSTSKNAASHPILNVLAIVGALAIAAVVVALFLGIRP